MKRFFTILIALLMTTTGMAVMVTASPGDHAVPLAEATGDELDCASQDPAPPECDSVGEPGAAVTEGGVDAALSEADEIIDLTPCDPRTAPGGECQEFFDENSPVAFSQDGDYQVITIGVGEPAFVIRANAATQHLTVVDGSDNVLFDSADDPTPDAGGEQLVATFDYTMTPCDDQDLELGIFIVGVNTGGHPADPFCYERLRSGIWVDIDSTPGDPSLDDSIEEDGTLESWARIRFDDDAFGAEDFEFDGDQYNNQPVGDANEDPHERASGAFHIGPEICTYRTQDTNDAGTAPNPRCSRVGNQYEDTFTGDGRAWDTISEIHLKQPPGNDYARYFLHSDLDDDGFSDLTELLNCGTHPFHQESTCIDYDGDELPNDIELLWGADVHDRDSDNDGLIDGLEDTDADGLLDAPAAKWDVAIGAKPVGDDTSVMYSDETREVNKGDDLLAGDDATITREPLTAPGDPAHRDGKNFDNPYPAHPAERDRQRAMGIETSPVSADTDDDGSRDWHSKPSVRDAHPRDGDIDNQDVDGDLLFDACEWQPLAPGRLDARGSYGTTDDHAADEDGDGLSNKDDCDLPSRNPWDYDSDNDGLDDWEEANGMLKDGTGLPAGAPLSFTPSNPATPDSDRLSRPSGHPLAPYTDGIPDGVEVLGDWNGDTLPTRVTVKGDCLIGCDELVPGTDPIDPPTLHADVLDVRIVGDVELALCALGLSGVTCDDIEGVPNVVDIDLEVLHPVVTNPRSVDTDGDGLWDEEEIQGFWSRERMHCGNSASTCNWELSPGGSGAKAFLPSDPTNPDSDGDGEFTDGQEVKDRSGYSGSDGPVNCHYEGHGTSGAIHNCDGGRGTEPMMLDTDADGILDVEETFGPFVYVRPHDPQADPCLAVILCGGPSNQRGNPRLYDSDEDGLGDGYELKSTTIRPDAAHPTDAFDPVGLPADATCGGGSCDGGYGTDPKRADSELDGVTDVEEVFGDFGRFFDPDPAPYTTPTDPLVRDSDGDGLADGEELSGAWSSPTSLRENDDFVDEENNMVDSGTFLPSDPAVEDTDGDGLDDGVEVKDTENPQDCPPKYADFSDVHRDILVSGDIYLEPGCDGGTGTEAALPDTDGDGYSDSSEIENMTDPLDPLKYPDGDDDDDNMNDAWEVKYFGSTDVVDDREGDYDEDGATNGEEHDTADGDPFTLESNPADPDSTPGDRDGDGLGRSWENSHFPPSDGYADEGVLPDGDEDEDGLTNQVEHDEEYFVNPPSERDPLFPETGPTDPADSDTDGDELLDGEEVDIGTNPLLEDTDEDGLTDKEEVDGTTDPNNADTDFDGLNDGAEREHGTDPNDVDSDGDGYSDGLEVDQGKDPNDPESNPGNDVEAASIPNPIAVATNPECDFTTPAAWREETGTGVTKWDSQACDDTSVAELAGPALSDLLTEINRLQEELEGTDPSEPLGAALDAGDTLVDFAGERTDEIIAEAQLLDQSDPRDLDGDGNTFEANGQIDQVERNLIYIDRDEDNVGPVDEFSGEDGFTVTVMYANSGSVTGPVADHKALVVRVGDVSGTSDKEQLVIESGNGNNRVTFCITEDNKRYVALGWFEDVGCSRYTEAGNIAGVPLGHDISDRDNDGVPHTIDNCPETSNPTQDDQDENGVGDACDGDRDGDGVPDQEDEFPDDSSETEDSDGDGVGDNSDFAPNDPAEWDDTDGDNVGDNADNCPETPNADQADMDGDGEGDACDDDIDGDLFPNDAEAEAESDPRDPESTPLTVIDENGDGMPDAAEESFDNDCYDYPGGQGVYMCHVEGSDGSKNYYVFVFGVVIGL